MNGGHSRSLTLYRGGDHKMKPQFVGVTLGRHVAVNDRDILCPRCKFALEHIEDPSDVVESGQYFCRNCQTVTGHLPDAAVFPVNVTPAKFDQLVEEWKRYHSFFTGKTTAKKTEQMDYTVSDAKGGQND